MRRLRQARDGVAAIEFALLTPIFLALLFGTVEFGRALWTRQVLQETAVAGARCMAIQQTECASGGSYSQSSTTTYIQQVARRLGVTLTTITPNNNTVCGGTGGFSQVSLASTFTSPMSALIKISSSGITLTASACYPNNPA
jgi:Flp pilus assembly protein TadG